MWDELLKLNTDKEIDMKKSFYCGDAAGRKKNKLVNRKKNDFSNSDYLFALNLGIEFYTPERLFFGVKERLPGPKFNPKVIPKKGPVFVGGKMDDKIASDTKEMIIFVGSPGSGKSTFWKNHL